MKTLVPMLLFVLLLPATARGQALELDATELLADPDSWSGDRVAVVGELIGDYSEREDGVWVQLNDDSYAGAPLAEDGQPEGANIGIGARLPVSVFTETVEGGPGRYDRRGPIVRLEGTFIHADPGLGGETYLAVDSATLIEEGRPLPVPGPDLWSAVGGGLLLAAGIIAYVVRHRNGALTGSR